MPRITFDVDDETWARVREAAAAAGVSPEAWVAGIVRERTGWPAEVVALAGGWADLPDAEATRQGEGTDPRREPL